MNWEQKISSGVNKTIDFTSYTQMNKHIPAEHFSAHWTGYLLVPQDLEYTFYLILDDGGKLFMDGKPIIDQWQDHFNEEFHHKVFLTKGAHKIRIDFYNDEGGLALNLFWKPKGGKKVIIPVANLRTSL